MFPIWIKQLFDLQENYEISVFKVIGTGTRYPYGSGISKVIAVEPAVFNDYGTGTEALTDVSDVVNFFFQVPVLVLKIFVLLILNRQLTNNGTGTLPVGSKN